MTVTVTVTVTLAVAVAVAVNLIAATQKRLLNDWSSKRDIMRCICGGLDMQGQSKKCHAALIFVNFQVRAKDSCP